MFERLRLNLIWIDQYRWNTRMILAKMKIYEATKAPILTNFGCSRVQ